MSKKLLTSLLLGLIALPSAWGADYGLPTEIQQGNILHCFNWTAQEVKNSLAEIAAAGFGSVQLSPCQRPDIRTGSSWHDLYRPYDLAFKSSSYCSEQDLKDLCAEAATYGIKVIVDVVANHVDKTAGYHDTWWDANGRVRWNGGINYGDRYSITHGQLGDYGDINSEDPDVIAKGKAYVEKLKELGVKGCRWDAAKHIGLPSEGCNFWSTVTSVPGMWHYGEILDAPGPNASIIKEYTNYMSVTDNKYCNGAARGNGGIPSGYAGDHVVNYGCPDTKMVYWGESHDTYSNDEWSQDVDQSVIDRAYAAYACRNGATALYLARPNTKGFSNIKVGKGSTAFTSKHITEVNKFRNLMRGKKDWFESNGNACSITRENGGAVVVMKGSGNVSVANGGGYCPAGTYTDKVAGGRFTVTSSTISGSVGSSGIAVLVYDGATPPIEDPDDPIEPTNPVTISGDYNVAYSGDYTKVYYWGGTSKPAWPGVAMTEVKGSDNRTYKVAKVAAGTTMIIFNNGSAQTGDLTYSGQFIMDNNGATSTPVKFETGNIDDPIPPTPGDKMWILGDIEGARWTTDSGAEMTLENNVYVAKNVELTLASATDTYCYFNITDALGATWDELNMNANRYGAATEGVHVPTGTPVAVKKYANNVDASNCKSWTIEPGTYDFAFDLTTMKLTATASGDEPRPVKPVVTANPASGTSFTESLTVTLSVTPEATIYYSLSGAATTSSTRYTTPIVLTETTTISTLAVTAEGAEATQSFSYTKNNDDPIPPVGPEHYIYFDGTEFTQPLVWAWNGSTNCTAKGTWGGDEMIRKDGKWYWELPEGKVVPAMVIIHEGENKAGGKDLVYVDRATYHQDGTYTEEGGDDPIPPTPTGKMWLLGDIEGSRWTTDKGAEMTLENNVYVAKDVNLTLASVDDNNCFFNITDALGATWDALNTNANRYGAATEGVHITVDSPVSVTKYANNIDASNCKSWSIEPGIYDFAFDPSAMKLTATKSGFGVGVSDLDAEADEPIYFDLQGMRIDRPTTGLYIVVRGNRVTKEYVR